MHCQKLDLLVSFFGMDSMGLTYNHSDIIGPKPIKFGEIIQNIGH